MAADWRMGPVINALRLQVVRLYYSIRNRRLHISASEAVTWSFLAGVGRTVPMRLTALVPLLGTVLLFNETVTDWLRVSPLVSVGLDTEARAALTLRSLYFTYFGLCTLGIGSIVFAVRCPGEIQASPSASAAVERALRENSRVISNLRYSELLRLFFTAKGILGPRHDPEFDTERLDMPDNIAGAFSVLINEMSQKVTGIHEYVADLAEEEWRWFSVGPHGRLNTDAVAELLWNRQQYLNVVWSEFEGLAPEFIKDISYLRFLMLNVSRYRSRALVFALFALGFALLSMPTLTAFGRIGARLLLGS